MTSQQPRRSSSSGYMRFVGAGLEIAGAAIVFALVGYAIDSAVGNGKQSFAVAGLLFGFGIGFVRLVLMAMRANAAPPRDKPRD